MDDAGAQKLDAAGGKIAGLEFFVRTLQGPAEVAHAQPPDFGANLRLADRGGPEEAPENGHEASKAVHLFTPDHASAIQSREGANGTDGAPGGAATNMVDMDCLEARKARTGSTACLAAHIREREPRIGVSGELASGKSARAPAAVTSCRAITQTVSSSHHRQ